MHPKILKLQKLTKKFLFSLEEGLFITAGISMSVYDAEPICEYVGPVSEREDLWKRIKEAEANGRMCAIFKEFGDYCLWWENFVRKNLRHIVEIEAGHPSWKP